jgi:hypothetical protein
LHLTVLKLRPKGPSSFAASRSSREVLSISTQIHSREGAKNAKPGVKGEPYSQNTLRDYITTLKRFYLWLSENGVPVVPADKVKKDPAARLGFDDLDCIPTPDRR